MTPDSDPPVRDYSTMEMAALTAGVCIGDIGMLAMPYLLGGAADRFDISSGGSGLISSVHLTMMAITSVSLSRSIHKIDRKQFAFMAAVLALISHIVAAVVVDWHTFLLGRIGAGIGEGALFTVAVAAGAGTQQPQRTFAIMTFALTVLAASIYVCMPWLAERFGPMSIFYVTVIVSALGVPIIAFMPRGLSQIAYPGTRGSGVLNEFPWVLIGVMCFFAGTGGVWAFSERIAVDAKLTPHEIGLAYTVAVVMTTLAPIAAHFSQKNWGYKKPVVISLIALTLVSISIGYTFSYHMFFVAMMMFNFLYVYLLPFYRSLTAILDPSGRIPAMSIAIQCISAALGPFLASIVLLAGFGYPVVSICCGIVVLLSLAFVLGVAQKSDETKSMAYKGL